MRPLTLTVLLGSVHLAGDLALATLFAVRIDSSALVSGRSLLTRRALVISHRILYLADRHRLVT
jgi:hypothetical protein